MSGLAWLNELMLWLGKWFPRLSLIKTGYVGVLFGRGGTIRRLSSGLYCYWPITSDLQIVSTRVRTAEVCSQLHGSEVVSLVVMFKIADPLKSLVYFDDLFGAIDDRTQAHLASAYRPGIENDALCDGVLGALRAECSDHGVEICDINVAQRGRVFALKNLNDWAQHSRSEL